MIVVEEILTIWLMSKDISKTFHQLITVIMLVILLVAYETMPNEQTIDTKPYLNLINNFNSS